MSKKFTSIGTAIKTWRNYRDISQYELAKSIGYKNGQYISNVERGLSGFPSSKIVRLCNVLDIETDRIVDAILEDHKREIKSCIQISKIKQVELPEIPSFLRSNAPDLVYFR